MNITLDTIQLKRDTAANWTSKNPVLLLGEPGIETDTGQAKIGDGTTAWASLPYVGAGAAGYPTHAGDALIADFTGDGNGITTIDVIDQYGTAVYSGIPRSSFVGDTVAVLSGTHNGGKLFTVTSSGPYTVTSVADGDELIVANPALPGGPVELVRESGNAWVPIVPEPPAATLRHHHYSDTNVTVTVTDGVLTYNSIEHDVDDTAYTVHLPSGDTIVGQTLTYKVGVDSGGTRPDLTFSAPFTGNVDHVFTTDKGGWDPSTNTPTLANGTGTAGDYYTVTADGTRNLGAGSDNYTVDEGVVYASGVWVHVQHGSIGHGRDYLLEQTWRMRQTGTVTFLKQGGGRWYLQAEDYDAKQKILFPEIDTGATTVEVVLQDYSELVLTDDTEITVTRFSEPGTITRLAVVQDGTGGWAVTWAGTSIAWVAGSEPVIDTASDAKTLIYIAQIGTDLIGWPVEAGGGGGGGGGASLSDDTPAALGTAAAGTGTEASRSDHVHTMPSASDVGAVPTARTVTAGTGLSGGGDLSTNRTLAIDTSVVVDKTTAQTLTNKTLTAPAISSPTGITKSDVGLSAVTNDAQAKAATTLTAGTGLTGGGDLSTSRTLAIDTSVTVDKTTAQTLTNKTLTSPAITTPTGIVKGDVGLGNVDNTSDATKALLVANNQTGTSYTLVLGDAAKVIEANNASAITLTVPTNASVPFPIGTIVELYAMGAGQVTVTAAGGVTLRAPHGAKTFTQYSLASLWKRDTDTWVVSGDVTT